MKQHLVGAVLASVVVGIGQAWGVDITIPDPHTDRLISDGSKADTFTPEAGRVEWNAVANETWDLKKFDLTGNTLSVNGSFNFFTGLAGGSIGQSDYDTPMGDIFIYVGNAPYTVKVQNDNSPNPIDVAATPDYIIKFNRATDDNQLRKDLIFTGSQAAATISYTIYSGATFEGTGIDGSPLYKGLPWIYAAGGTSIASGNATYASTGTPYSAGFDNTLGGINLASLNLNGDVWFHTTMQCGNDVMWGKTPVADGGLTVMMLGMGLVGLGMARRKQR